MNSTMQQTKTISIINVLIGISACAFLISIWSAGGSGALAGAIQGSGWGEGFSAPRSQEPAFQNALLDKQEEAGEEERIAYLIGKLKDRTYTDTYGEGYTWYTAAEELGTIGKAAVPALIANLGTEDDYERALTLYALLLTTQEPDVKAFASDYIHANLYFDPSTHPEMVAEANAWWEKYKDNWE